MPTSYSGGYYKSIVFNSMMATLLLTTKHKFSTPASIIYIFGHMFISTMVVGTVFEIINPDGPVCPPPYASLMDAYKYRQYPIVDITAVSVASILASYRPAVGLIPIAGRLALCTTLAGIAYESSFKLFPRTNVYH